MIMAAETFGVKFQTRLVILHKAIYTLRHLGLYFSVPVIQYTGSLQKGFPRLNSRHPFCSLLLWLLIDGGMVLVDVLISS